VLDVDTFPLDMLGEAKKQESLSKVITSVTSLRNRNSFGRIDIRFAPPISLRRYTEDFIRRAHKQRFNDANTAAAGVDGEGEAVMGYVEMSESELVKEHQALATEFLAGENFALVDELACSIVGDMMRESMVMPTGLVASLCLKRRREGLTFFELVEEVNWLRSHLQLRGCRVGTYEATPTEVRRALSLLHPSVISLSDAEATARQHGGSDPLAAGGPIGAKGGGDGEVVYLPGSSGLETYLMLHYYENTLLHVVFTEGILATAWAGLAAGEALASPKSLEELTVDSVGLQEAFVFLNRILSREVSNAVFVTLVRAILTLVNAGYWDRTTPTRPFGGRYLPEV